MYYVAIVAHTRAGMEQIKRLHVHLYSSPAVCQHLLPESHRLLRQHDRNIVTVPTLKYLPYVHKREQKYVLLSTAPKNPPLSICDVKTDQERTAFYEDLDDDREDRSYDSRARSVGALVLVLVCISEKGHGRKGGNRKETHQQSRYECKRYR